MAQLWIFEDQGYLNAKFSKLLIKIKSFNLINKEKHG
jgi:hypothetical protein